MHALIIEDQFLVAALIEDMLRDLGYTSFHVVSGAADAIRAAGERRPDLVTADHRLADGDGDGVGAVRAICAAGAVPVVFISEYGEEVRALAPEAVLIAKPFNDRMLRAAVEKAKAQAAGCVAAVGC
jgi:DNA-binding response OmpR family regulator